jgi:hypothetical protein
MKAMSHVVSYRKEGRPSIHPVRAIKFTAGGKPNVRAAAGTKKRNKLGLPVNRSIDLVHDSKEAQKSQEQHEDGILVV